MNPAAKQYYQCANSPNSELSKFIGFACPLYKKSKLPGNFRSGGYRLDGSGIALCPECYNQKRQKYFDDINKIETAYGFPVRHIHSNLNVRAPVTRCDDTILTERPWKSSNTVAQHSETILTERPWTMSNKNQSPEKWILRGERIPTEESSITFETSEKPATIRQKKFRTDTSKKAAFATRIMSEARPIPNFYERYNSDLGSSESDGFVLNSDSIDSSDIDVAIEGLSIKVPRKKRNATSSPAKNRQEEFVCRPKPRKNTKTAKARLRK